MNKSALVKSTGIVALSTLLSRIMGYVRDKVIASFFGTTAALDGFFIAFRIPNLLRRLVAEGSLTISFIPVYTDYLVTKGEKEALELSQKVLSILILILLTLVAFGEIFSSQIVGVIAFGFDNPEQISLTIELNRIMFPYIFFVSIVAFSMGVLNSKKYFFAPAFAPVLLNVGFIFGAVVLSNYFAEPLYGLALGVILGGLLQVILQIPYLAQTGFRIKFSIDFKHPGIRRIFSLLAPAMFGIAVYEFNGFMNSVLASMLPDGSVSYLYYTDRLTEIVLGIFIISIGNVILPEMSRMSINNDGEKLKELYIVAVRASLFLAIPAAIALMVSGYPIVSVLFMGGKFNSFSAEMTTRSLFYASIGVPGLAILRITSPTFYSLKDTRTPALCAAAAFIINITCGYLLMQTVLLHAGLSLAISISVIIQTSLLVIFLRRRIGRLGIKKIGVPVCKFIIASLAMAFTIYMLQIKVDWVHAPLLERVLYLAGIVSAGGIVYFVVCAILRVDEISYFLNKIFKRMAK